MVYSHQSHFLSYSALTPIILAMNIHNATYTDFLFSHSLTLVGYTHFLSLSILDASFMLLLSLRCEHFIR